MYNIDTIQASTVDFHYTTLKLFLCSISKVYKK